MNVRPGDRIRLLSMASDPDPIPEGSTGTVESVTCGPLGQIGVRWDSGRTLYLVPGIDIFQIIADEPTEKPDHGKVKLPADVLTGIEAVRQSGATNMLDRPAVQRIARELGYEEIADWLADKGNHPAYAQGIFRGFEPDDE